MGGCVYGWWHAPGLTEALPVCRELEVSASAYRARRTRPSSSRSLRDVWLLAQIRRVHEGSNGVYGQLKVWDELNDTGVGVARCTAGVQEARRPHGWRASHRHPGSSTGGGPFRIPSAKRLTADDTQGIGCRSGRRRWPQST